MNKNTRTTNRPPQKNNKREANTSGRMRFFYILMLLLTIFSLVVRLGGSRRSTSATTPTSTETAARLLVFHEEHGSVCEDLAISAAGNAVLSACGNGLEKQYTLSSSERARVQGWVETYKVVNYDQNEPAQAGGAKTQLYLNGRGSRQASEAEIRQLVDFAETLAQEVAAQS